MTFKETDNGVHRSYSYYVIGDKLLAWNTQYDNHKEILILNYYIDGDTTFILCAS